MDTSRGSSSVWLGPINQGFSSTITGVGAGIFISCMIINHFTTGWPSGEIDLFETEGLWFDLHDSQRKRGKTTCPFEVSLSRTLTLHPFIHSHVSLGKSSQCKCRLNARTCRTKWIAGASLCIGARVSFPCMTIKHFLVDLKDKFGGDGGQRKRGERKRT